MLIIDYLNLIYLLRYARFFLFWVFIQNGGFGQEIQKEREGEREKALVVWEW